jgi:hypothetical protein
MSGFYHPGRALLGSAMLALAAVLLVALFLLGSGVAKGEGSFTAYAACSRTGESAPAAECTVGDEVGLFFRSDSGDAVYELCVVAPGGTETCIADQQAEQGTLYLNNLTAGVSGLYTATWSVGGEAVATWKLTLKEKETTPTSPTPQPPVVDPKDCENSPHAKLCEVEYHVAIAGISLGDSRQKVLEALGRPLRVTRTFKNTLCPVGQRREGQRELRLPVTRLTYIDHLTISLMRLSHSESVCSQGHRLPGPVVTRVSTSSPHDNFTSGIHVGSTLAAVKRTFQKYDMNCFFDESGPLNNTCSVALVRPTWIHDPAIIGFMAFRIEHRKVRAISLFFAVGGA